MFPTIHRFDVIFIKNPENDDANFKCRHQEKTSSSQNFQQKCLKQTWGQKDFDARKLRFVQKIPKKTFLWAVSRQQSFTFGENISLHYLVKVYFPATQILREINFGRFNFPNLNFKTFFGWFHVKSGWQTRHFFNLKTV